MNYTIFLQKRLEDGRIVPNGVKFVAINNKREQTDLEYAITDHYKAVSGRDINAEEIGLSQQTTVLDKTSGADSNKPRKNSGNKLKVGDELRSGSETMTVGAK